MAATHGGASCRRQLLHPRLVDRLRLPWLAELCPACRSASPAGFCGTCAAAFRTVPDPCPVCALPRGAGGCEKHGQAWRIARTWSAFEYAEPLAHYLQALKFGRNRALGRALGLLVVAGLEGARTSSGDPHGSGGFDVDALVPVPLSPGRLRERGYNQAVEIARPLASALGLPLLLGGVARPVGGRAQSRLGARARQANVADAFRVRRRCAGLALAVVDDVITTGATVNALAAALEGAGAVRVEAVAVARTV